MSLLFPFTSPLVCQRHTLATVVRLLNGRDHSDESELQF